MPFCRARLGPCAARVSLAYSAACACVFCTVRALLEVMALLLDVEAKANGKRAGSSSACFWHRYAMCMLLLVFLV
jgi:hypothetical protein